LVKKYTKEQIKIKWKDICHSSPELLYRNGETLFNYTGKLLDDPKIYYIDYLSKLIIEDFNILEKIGKNPENLRDSNPFKKHFGISNSSIRLDKFGYIKFAENPFGIALFNSKYRFSFGEIFEYNLSLKEYEKNGTGAVDLLSCQNNEIILIELKTNKKNGETLLRAIMEVFTFVILLNIRKVPAIVTFSNIESGENMKKLEDGELSNLKELIIKMNDHIATFGILPFKFFAFEPPIPELIQDKKGRIVFKDQNFPISSKVLEYSYI